MINHFSVFLATGFGSSFLVLRFWALFAKVKKKSCPKQWTGAGFIGTVIGAWMVWAGIPLTGWSGFGVLLSSTLVAIFVSEKTEKIFQKKDDPRIVVDEIVGFFWSMGFIPLRGLTEPHQKILLVSAFVLFRIFDVIKWPYPGAQKWRGGVGVVADDCLAGLLANALLQVAVRSIL